MAFLKQLARPKLAGALKQDCGKKRCALFPSSGWPVAGHGPAQLALLWSGRCGDGDENRVVPPTDSGGGAGYGSSGYYRSKTKSDGRRLGVAAFAFAVGTVGGGLYWILNKQNGSSGLLSLTNKNNFGKVFAEENIQPGKIKHGLPTYTQADVAAHNSKESRIWVTFGNGVYDITEYVDMHPGGKKILMASGKSIEPFWSVYSVHKTQDIYEILESHRIGNITDVAVQKTKVDETDPFKNEPQRSPLLIPSSEKPYNAEPPQEMLVDNFVTPSHLFFIRNHLPVPCVNIKEYTLDLQLPSSSASLTFEDLQTKFKKCSVTAVTQCAGNRRSEMVKIKPVKGLNWGIAAISNGKWSGVVLDELLKFHGVDIENVRAKYIVFEGLDKQEDGTPYGASIPLELAKMFKNDIIIAYEMNGAEIPRDHGYPVRAIVPGVVGARQVKWLKKIYFSAEESTSHWQRNDYKGFNSSVDWHNVNFDKSVSISQLPVTSAICEPVEGAEIEEGASEVTLKGYAWSGGGRGIIRVDVSADGGKTWHEARLKPNGQTQYKSYAWTLWEADVPLPSNVKQTTLVCKAVDVSYNVQPDSVEGIWNLRGCLSNAWHRVNVKLAASQVC
ncbi:hypothetical protein BsWGS_16851 [Bradybaena similaris]